MLTAVTGINWGDEGKGRVIDLLAENADVVVRYQGGNNAGHTVVTKQGKFLCLVTMFLHVVKRKVHLHQSLSMFVKIILINLRLICFIFQR